MLRLHEIWARCRFPFVEIPLCFAYFAKYLNNLCHVTLSKNTDHLGDGYDKNRNWRCWRLYGIYTLPWPRWRRVGTKLHPVLQTIAASSAESERYRASYGYERAARGQHDLA